MRRLTVVPLAICWVAAGMIDPALAQTFNSGSTSADGAFTPTTSVTLTLPPTGIFNFTSVTIPSGVTRASPATSRTLR